ncbi:MAG TPA: hypothetical protein VIC52_05535 [Actinomycetota bacterium]|jgi:hypothetical protein
MGNLTPDLEVRLVVYPGGAEDRRARPHRTTWGALTTSLTTRRVCPDKELTPGWSPVELRPGRWRRAIENIATVWALVLDYDGTCTLEQAREMWAPWGHMGHTTWSGVHKCRVVVPLTLPCPAELWPRVYAWARGRDPRIDRSTSDASRLWFAPSTATEGAPFVSWTHPGPSLSLEYSALEDPARPQPRPLGRQSGVGARRLAVARLDDPEVRRRAADYLRAQVNAAGVAKGGRCPVCGRNSVWWVTTKAGAAVCNHRSSCGWVGSLARLLDAVDLAA